MSTPNLFWFHCGRCGSLFQSQPGDDESRRCSKCGFDPCPGILDPVVIPPQAVAPAVEEPRESSENQRKRTHKKRKNTHFMAKLIVGWLLLIACIVVGAKLLWPETATERDPLAANPEDPSQLSGEDADLLNRVGAECSEVFAKFLASTSLEERNQFVLSPVTTAPRMVKFYSMNSPATIDPQTTSIKENAVLHLPGEMAIETSWVTKNGKTFDAVFRQSDNEWRLDWDHFIRYSDCPWSLFLAGTGDPEGEFRLLARERTIEERKDKDKTLSLVLYAPKFGDLLQTGFQSPEFVVSRDSAEGRLLEAAFAQAREGAHPFDSKLTHLTPDGMIRVNVRVSRTNTDSGRRFAITKVIACHWYSVNDPGVEPATPEAEKPAEN